MTGNYQNALTERISKEDVMAQEIYRVIDAARGGEKVYFDTKEGAWDYVREKGKEAETNGTYHSMTVEKHGWHWAGVSTSGSR